VEGAANHPYAVPNVEVRYSMANVGVPVGFWRSVANSQNAFLVESFVDELAHAVVESFGSYVAEVAEVSVEGSAVPVHRVACAVVCGVAVNPDEVRSQMEGGIVYGLTAALNGEITLKDGAVKQSRRRLARRRRRAGHAADRPAVANAIFALTGRRIRSLPIRLGAPA